MTLSFLIASPLVNEIAIGLLLTLFGGKITLAYIGAGLAIAIAAGWVLGRLSSSAGSSRSSSRPSSAARSSTPPPA